MLISIPEAKLDPNATNLTSGSLLARNSIWNLAGQLLPMFAGLVCVPPLLHRLGVTRFGVLSLVWIIIGYFSLFDLGLGRAVTKAVADRLGAGTVHRVSCVVWSAVSGMFFMGLIVGACSFFCADWFVIVLLKVPKELQAETIKGFRLLAISLPFVTVSFGLKGVLEATQEFGLANLIRIPMSIASFVAPVIALPFSDSIFPIIGILVALRVLGCIFHVYFCLRVLPCLRGFEISWIEFHSLLKFGGWITLSNFLGPLVGYADRFIVASVLSVSVIAFYTTPLDVVTRLTIIPGALAGVLFPAFAVALIQDRERAQTLIVRASKYILIAIFPIVLLLMAFAPELLLLWLGPNFASQATGILRWLSFGVFINCFGQVPFAFIQSANRPDITAKLYLVELPVYAAAVWVVTLQFGLAGAAIVWVGRVIVDCILLAFFSHRLLQKESWELRNPLILLAAAVCALCLVIIPREFEYRVVAVAILGILSALWAWSRILDQKERELIADRIFSRLSLGPGIGARRS